MELLVHLEISPPVGWLEISANEGPGSSVEHFTGTQWPATTTSQAVNSRTEASEEMSGRLLVWND